MKKLVQLLKLLKDKIMSWKCHSGKFKTEEMTVQEKFQGLDKEILSWRPRSMKNKTKLIVSMMKFPENKQSLIQRKEKSKVYNSRWTETLALAQTTAATTLVAPKTLGQEIPMEVEIMIELGRHLQEA